MSSDERCMHAPLWIILLRERWQNSNAQNFGTNSFRRRCSCRVRSCSMYTLSPLHCAVVLWRGSKFFPYGDNTTRTRRGAGFAPAREPDMMFSSRGCDDWLGPRRAADLTSSGGSCRARVPIMADRFSDGSYCRPRKIT